MRTCSGARPDAARPTGPIVDPIVSIGTQALIADANYGWVKHLTQFQRGGTGLEPLAWMVS